MERVDITKRYFANQEIRPDLGSRDPYLGYLKALESTFDLTKINSVIDVGCATGRLLQHIKKGYPNVKVAGIEYFDYHKKAADPSVQESIVLHDLRDPLPTMEKYDIVNCTEVGEHIDPEYEKVLMENLTKLTKRYLITTWSSEPDRADKPKELHQHLNPKSLNSYKQLVESFGFKENKTLTEKMVKNSVRQLYFHNHWRKPLVVWEKE